ncbi:MAG TPA: TetR family transcriptional regulator [Acidimicrobiales bacterium]|nr:TetR family transcriptional regulator [Acidimicrobiales bacterium]
MAVRGEAARAALVEAAERLFAQRGIEGVSLRDVSAAAGQRNHNAAQYHFGDRLGLVAAVYENRMRVVNQRRQAHLTGVADGDVRGLVAAIVVPLVEVVAEVDGWYARFQARARWDTEAWDALQRVATGAPFATAMRKLNRALDDLSRPIRHSRLDQLMTLVLGTIAGWEGAGDRGQARLSPEVLADELISTGVAVLTAPVLERTRP